MEIPLIFWVLTGMGLTLVGSFLSIWLLGRKVSHLRHKARSLSTRHGMMAEQFLPFLKNFPGNPQKFKFLGAPVDGILFDDDKIVIVEFKTGRSQLSSTQRQIKDLISRGRVYFKEVRLGS